MTCRVDAHTRVAALYGHPVSHSLSPALQNAAFNKLNMNVIYLTFNVTNEELPRAVESVRNLNFLGLNLTHPHKRAVLSCLDHVSEQAGQIAAVNTVVNRQGILTGYNTDGDGFLRSLHEDYEFQPRGKRIVILGAGGAGRAISWALGREDPERMTVVNRTIGRARKWAERISARALAWEDPQVHREIERAHLLVNAAAVPLEVNADLISEGALVYDIVYNQERPDLAEKIRGRGARWADGRSLLLHQGALAFELWTGRQAPLAVMRQALRDASKRGIISRKQEQGEKRC